MKAYLSPVVLITGSLRSSCADLHKLLHPGDLLSHVIEGWALYLASRVGSAHAKTLYKPAADLHAQWCARCRQTNWAFQRLHCQGNCNLAPT